MTLDIKSFANFLTQKDTKKAREWLEQNKGTINPDDEFTRGYFLALQGMISGLEAGGELSVIKQIVNGRYQQEKIEKLIHIMKEKLSLKFRPKDEQGFDTAWLEILQEFSGKKD